MLVSYSVIGANFGDEGKGSTVDHIANQLSKQKMLSLNVKINGGCQAGHTVIHDNGKPNIFHQLGSASFHNIPTFISQYCILNILELINEIQEIGINFNIKPVVIIDEQVIITTPFDEIINRCMELSRKNPHGSCGFGINETVVRHQTGYSVDLGNVDTIYQQLDNIRKYFNKTRIPEIMNMDDIDEHKFYDLVYNENSFNESFWIEGFVQSLLHLKTIPEVTFIDDQKIKSMLKAYHCLIIEHSQGLLLDQYNLSMFPHLTRSNTGSRNVKLLFNDNELDLTLHHNIYVTRAYLTRHGNGPLPFEEYSEVINNHFNIVDPTNVPNTYQGTIRVAPFNIDLFIDAVNEDLIIFDQDIGQSYFNMTCLDQIVNQDNPKTIPITYNTLGFLLQKSVDTIKVDITNSTECVDFKLLWNTELLINLL